MRKWRTLIFIFSSSVDSTPVSLPFFLSVSSLSTFSSFWHYCVLYFMISPPNPPHFVSEMFATKKQEKKEKKEEKEKKTTQLYYNALNFIIIWVGFICGVYIIYKHNTAKHSNNTIKTAFPAWNDITLLLFFLFLFLCVY